MGQVLDTRYRVVELLGSGGMAEVYLAHDAVLDRDVALKVLSQRFTADEEVVERFRSEARSAAALCHPNIVPVYDRGQAEDGTYYIVMEYLPGGTLKELISREGPLPPHTTTAAAIQVAEALKEAHRRGLIHRDVKPQNILLTESGELKVADFGIARAASSATLTRTGVVLGSVHYMSPEQAVGATVDPRSDLYSLGVVLYEMLTGEPPYDAENPITIAMKHVEGRLRPPREADPSIPQGMNAVTVRLLAKDPEERYPDAASLLEDLDRMEKGLSPTAATTRLVVGSAAQTAGDGRPTAPWEASAEAPSPPAPHRKRKQRRRIVPVIVTATLLAALALVGTVGPGLWENLLGWSSEMPVVEASSLVEVPDVAGQGVEEASEALREAGLKVGPEHETAKSEEPEGTVVGTDPPAGSEVEEGTSVTLTVSRGTPKEGTGGLDASTGTFTAPVPNVAEPNTQRPAPTPVPPPSPAAPITVAEQADPEQGTDYGEQVPEDRTETQAGAQEGGGGEIQEVVHQAVQEIQDTVEVRAEKPRGGRADD